LVVTVRSREETFRHENLEVWQLAVRFANQVYRESRTFPPEERYGLALQLRRAAVSVASNIAEGCGRRTKKDFARSIEIAYGSTLEAMTQLVVARDQGFL